MNYTITFTPESIARVLNSEYNQNFTAEDIERNWDGFTDYLENIVSNGWLTENLWSDFASYADEYEIDLFTEAE